MVTAVAPVTDQLSVLDCPSATLAGIAVKLLMVGRFPTVTATVTVVDPMLLLAVSA
jgi:hypothetical protein